ncbi:MAG: transketolase C-terminal domain-containing protein [Eubacteriales bacterium]
MKIILAKENVADDKQVRAGYAEVMTSYFDKGAPVMHLDADLMMASGMRPYWEKYPKNIIECGICEANMVGVACGLSAEGKIPFCHSFSVFIARRANDQIYMSGAYAFQNVKLLATDPGATAALNGGTHAGDEDIACIRAFPGITIIDVVDRAMMKSVVKLAVETYGMFYIRTPRMIERKVYEDGSEFEIGKAVKIRDGKDVTIIASGICVVEAIDAAKALEEEGISARVIDIFSIKPIDKDTVIAAAKETGAIVTAENHNVIGGLGSAVAEVLGEDCPTLLKRVGIKDRFGEVGKPDYLKEAYQITSKYIVEAAKEVVAKKK